MLSRSLSRPRKAVRRVAPRVFALEARQLMTADLLPTDAPSIVLPVAIGRPITDSQAEGASFIGPEAGTGPPVNGPFTPAQIRHAYGVDQLSYDGTGQTIAIVDAFDDTTIAADLKAFDARYGLPDPTFLKVNQGGNTTSYPTTNSGWDLEISLDVEWAHVMAPKATILLVEANSDSDTNLLKAVDTAAKMGASQISMSWGGGEYQGVSSLDTHFNKPGVTFIASAGDNGTEVDYPAVSPYVVGIGGTTISLDQAGDKLAETAWSDSGGGVSVDVNRPSFQDGFESASTRGVPDVSFDADLNSGVIVDEGGSFFAVGGTSVGAPAWAGLIALANQGRAALGYSPLGTGKTFGTNSVLYGLAGGTGYVNKNGDFTDITSGSNGLAAGAGYDNVTGLGSPVANKLIPDLIGIVVTPPSVPTVGDSGFENVYVGNGGYSYDPTGSAWAFTGSSGLTGNNSAFTSANPAAPQGSQVAFLQATGSFSQALANWAAGSYVISLDAAQRANNGSSVEDFQVLVDGVAVATFLPNGASYQAYTTASFTVGAGSHTITFKGLDNAGGDNTALIDAVAVAQAPATAPPPSVGDSGFENVYVGNGGYSYDPTGSAWAFTGSSGLTGNNSAFTSANPAAPQGSQVAFLQATGSFSQALANWAAGSYVISLDAAQRANNGSSVEDFQVLVDGVAVATFLPNGASYQAYTTAKFTVGAGTHTITFQGLDTAGGDNTALIDAVAVAQAPATAPPPSVGDSGFENVYVGNGGYSYDPTGSAWAFTGSSGLTGNNSAFTSANPAAPRGRRSPSSRPPARSPRPSPTGPPAPTSSPSTPPSGPTTAARSRTSRSSSTASSSPPSSPTARRTRPTPPPASPSEPARTRSPSKASTPRAATTPP